MRTRSSTSANTIPTASFERQLRDYKVKLAIDAVRENNGNKTLAARSLGISRAYLHRLIRLAEPDLIFEQDSVIGSANSYSQPGLGIFTFRLFGTVAVYLRRALSNDCHDELQQST